MPKNQNLSVAKAEFAVTRKSGVGEAHTGGWGKMGSLVGIEGIREHAGVGVRGGGPRFPTRRRAGCYTTTATYHIPTHPHYDTAARGSGSAYDSRIHHTGISSKSSSAFCSFLDCIHQLFLYSRQHCEGDDMLEQGAGVDKLRRAVEYSTQGQPTTIRQLVKIIQQLATFFL